MKILSIDTSCDDTSAAVTDDLRILSNIVYSQANLHSAFGGVYPTLAKREHQAKIDIVVNNALKRAGVDMKDIGAIAVTIGPGLAIALGIGINKAKEIALKYKLPLIPVNHIEAHMLSPLCKPYNTRNNNQIPLFPLLSLVISGGNTQIIKAVEVGKYQVLATTQDDALGEALDKGARMLGLGYPGGAILEKFAKLGNPHKHTLPIPMIGKEKRGEFSYSGLKTAMMRLIKQIEPLNKEQIYDLAASFQNTAIKHVEKMLDYNLKIEKCSYLLVGGGVSANNEIRKRIRKITRKYNCKVLFPYSKKLTGDNAAMIGITAFLNCSQNKSFVIPGIDFIDRVPKLKI